MGRMKASPLFAIGDVHGCYQELTQLIDRLPLCQDSTLVFLGDYVDRGPQSKQVIDFILELKTMYHVVALMGNHEDMMLEFLKDPSSSLAGFFILNGGSATLASYLNQDNNYFIPQEHQDFLAHLPLWYETDSHFFVHAGVPNCSLASLDQKEHHNDLLWIRKNFHNSQFPWKKVIVHGHTPKAQVEITDRRINLDTGCVFNGCLTAMNMGTGETYQVEATQDLPPTYLKENPQRSRVAKRFLGNIPVFIKSPTGYEPFSTVNYNEFGLLIVDQSGEERVFEVGQILYGKIGDPARPQIHFSGQVVRHQKRGSHIAYGIKMLERLKTL